MPVVVCAPVDFTIEQRLSGTVDRVQALLLDPAYVHARGELPKLGDPELVARAEHEIERYARRLALGGAAALFDGVERAARVGLEQPACLGQLDAARGAHEQRRAQLFFQAFELLPERGRRERDGPRRGTKVQKTCGFEEAAQAVKREAHGDGGLGGSAADAA